MSEQNKQLIRRGVDEVWNRGNLDAANEMLASDFVNHATGLLEETTGSEGIKTFFGALRSAFPDLTFTIEDHIAEGDRVVTRWSAVGTHKGDFQGIPATGKRVQISGTDIDRIENGKIAECWMSMDELGLLQQLGVVAGP